MANLTAKPGKNSLACVLMARGSAVCSNRTDDTDQQCMSARTWERGYRKKVLSFLLPDHGFFSFDKQRDGLVHRDADFLLRCKLHDRAIQRVDLEPFTGLHVIIH